MNNTNFLNYKHEKDKIKQWIYPVFFSTKSGAKKIKIINSVNVESKRISTIGNETNLSYSDVKYNIDILEQKKFLIKINKKYIISKKFRENYDVLHNISHPHKSGNPGNS